MKRPLTDHEYQVNGGAWIPCTLSNTTNNGDGTYTITDGLNVAIPIGQLKVRVKSLGINPASDALLNTTAFNAPLVEKNIQLFFIGDSITAGVGTTGTGSSASGQYNGGQDYPNQTLLQLSSLNITSVIRGFSGQTASWYNLNDLNTTISMFDTVNYSDIYCVVFFGANDLVLDSAAAFESAITTTCNALKAAGAKIILLPVLPRKDGSFNNNSVRATYNSWLSSNYSTIADSLVDFSAHPEFFGDSAADDATYYAAPDADGSSKVHPTNAGALIIANQLALKINELSLTASIPAVPVNYAADFITATGITDSTQIAAINGLVNDLVAAKIWTKFAAIYPFVGGSASAHKFNLRDPRDLDAAHRLIYTGAPTHDTNGVTWASGSYADTNFKDVPATLIFLNRSIHYYSRNTPGTAGIDMGAYTAGAATWLGIKFGGSSYSAVTGDSDAGTGESYTDTGLFSASRHNSPSQKSFFRNGALLRTVSAPFRLLSTPINQFIGCANSEGVPQYPSSRNCAYVAIGHGLTPDEEAAHYTIIQAYQTALGRAV